MALQKQVRINTLAQWSLYRCMANSRAKPNKPRPDGRKNNGRKPGTKIQKQAAKMTPAKLNKAKKERIKLYGINAIKEQYGSEEGFFKHLAEAARDSFPHLKLLMEYAYGKPEDYSHVAPKKQAPTIVFVNNGNKEPETIEVGHEEEV